MSVLGIHSNTTHLGCRRHENVMIYMLFILQPLPTAVELICVSIQESATPFIKFIYVLNLVFNYITASFKNCFV